MNAKELAMPRSLFIAALLGGYLLTSDGAVWAGQAPFGAFTPDIAVRSP
jgi:hypothetical protein